MKIGRSTLSMPSGRAVAAYMLLPGILPRLSEIGFRFTFVAAVMANLYAAVGLLPRAHPFLRADQMGRFSVRQVFIEAAKRLRFRLSHIDQIIMFGVLLSAFVLLITQFIFMGLYLTVGVAQAAGFSSIFQTENPTNDIALMLLDRVFGVPGYFNSCISTSAVCDPTSKMFKIAEPATFPEGHQLALQTLFAYFSMGALLLGGLIVVYYLIVVTLESAQTGVPLGKRFASFYAPMRLCIAVLMLVPIPTPGVSSGWIGYNSAQYLTLYLAGIGSSFGTNLWLTFNNTFIIGGQGVSMVQGYGPIITSPTKQGDTPGLAMVAQPKSPSVDGLIQFMMIARSCRAMYLLNPPGESRPAVDTYGFDIPGTEPNNIQAYAIAPKDYRLLHASTTIDEMTALKARGQIVIRFGSKGYTDNKIIPHCGELSFRISDLTKPGAKYLQEQYFTLIHMLWNDVDIVAFGDRMARIHMGNSQNNNGKNAACDIGVNNNNVLYHWGICDGMPNPDFYHAIYDKYQPLIDSWVLAARDKQVAAATGTIDDRILNRGWAGAGIWYNKLAELNGSLFDAARGLPIIKRMPQAMENIARQNAEGLAKITPQNRYTVMPIMGTMPMGATIELAKGLNAVYVYFQNGQFKQTDMGGNTGSMIFDLMNSLFGTQGLFDIRNDATTNPMVQLIALGKSIVDAALFNIMVGMGVEITGGALEQLDQLKGVGSGLNTMGNAWFSVATLGLGIGIMLYYVIPFMPFIYFFFAVVKWLQSIFEAMIGMPLWALAHLRIDGDGVPPDGAMGGYFLLFEIIIRPALTVIGMIASFIIFTALALTMNDIFDIMVVNLTGYNPPSTGSITEDLAIKKGTVDQFFYTVVYVIFVYMMALSCFKLIDRIPGEILRWIGSDAKNIIDAAGDDTAGLVQRFYVGSFGMPLVQESGPVGQAIQGLRGVAEGTGQMAGKGVKGVVQGGNKGVKGDSE